jgi:two-component system sensor histidine kinase KdpD
MNGTLNAEDTPGGGLTMVLTLRAADAHAELLEAPFAEAEAEAEAEPERQAT